MSNDTPLDPVPDDYADLAALARSLSLSDTHLDSPPDDLWPGIERRVAAGEHTAINTPGASSGSVGAGAWKRRRYMALGAAAVIVAAIVGLLAFVARDDGPQGTRVDEVALTNKGLEAAGAGSHGTATLVRTKDGSYALDIDANDLPSITDGFLELWIIDPTVTGMYSLGPLHGSGRYALPEHVDPAAFPIVDVSIEPTDGAPTHSGKSILRGQLTA
jgi:anti-sigma-K factor RskA